MEMVEGMAEGNIVLTHYYRTPGYVYGHQK